MPLGGNGKSVIMDAALLMGDDPYRYPDNLPIVNATGGPGGKPSCGSLPDISKNYPGEVPRHRHRVRHRPRCAAEPRHRLPGHRQLLPGHQGESGTAQDPLSRRSCAGPAAGLPRGTCPTAHRCTAPDGTPLYPPPPPAHRRGRTRDAVARACTATARGAAMRRNSRASSPGWCCSPRCAWSSCSCS